jgi:hypothetical protein
MSYTHAGPKYQRHAADRGAQPVVPAHDVLVLEAGTFLFHGTWDEDGDWAATGVMETPTAQLEGMNYFALDPTLCEIFTHNYLLAYRTKRRLRLINHRGNKPVTLSRRWSKETFDGAFGKVWLDQGQSGTPCLMKEMYRRRDYKRHEIIIHNSMIRGALEKVAVQPMIGKHDETDNFVITVLLLQMQLIHKFLPHAVPTVAFRQWAATGPKPVHGDVQPFRLYADDDIFYITSALKTTSASDVDDAYVTESYLKISWGADHAIQINQGGKIGIRTQFGIRTLDTCLYYLGDSWADPSYEFNPTKETCFYHNNKYYLISNSRDYFRFRKHIILIYIIDARTGAVDVAFLHPYGNLYNEYKAHGDLVWDMCDDTLCVHVMTEHSHWSTWTLQPSRVLDRPFSAPGQIDALTEACKARVAGLRL